MTASEYIVLRSSDDQVPIDRPIMRSGEATPRSATEVSDLEFHQLEADEASEVAAEADVELVAPSLPMQLISPLADSHADDDTETEPLDDPDVTWGVAAVGATNSPFSGGDIVPAVIDTGIEAGHPAFVGVDIVARNFTTEADEDLDGHGTHCAGTIFGRPVEGKRIGVADGVNKALVAKVISSQGASTASLFNAIQWTLAEGANVISMSLGIDFPGFVKDLIELRDLDPRVATSLALEGYTENVLLYQRLTTLMKSTVSFQQSATIVAAAGNESNRQSSPLLILNVAPPSAADGIRSVGALGRSPDGLTVASFSNANPDVSGPGVSVISAALGGGLRSLNGTSMATPHVAGVSVLWADKLLKETGRLDVASLEAKVLANASTAALAPDFKLRDVGAGLVIAPQT